MSSEVLGDVVLEVEKLSVHYGDTVPVDNISFTLRRGEKVGLVGESGSGKSLTALSIMRLNDRARLQGNVKFHGRDLLTLSQRQMTSIRGGRISMVYQDPMSSLNPVMTIGHQLIEAIRLHSSTTRRAAHVKAVEMLQDVGVSSADDRMKQYPHEFSGGMRQRVMIAMAMSGNPDILIADEPTTALDVTTQALIIDLLDRLAAKNNMAVILITHDLGVAAGFCETIHVMRQGKIVESAPAIELYRSPKDDYTRVLLKSIVDLAIDVKKPIPSADDGENDSENWGIRDLSDQRNTRTLLEVGDLTKTFSLDSGTKFKAVDGVSFKIRRGETFGLVGESGSGKSTVARAILALTGFDSGSVTFDGIELGSLRSTELRALRRRMQIVFQDPFSALNRRQTVARIIAAPLVAHGIGNRSERNEMVLRMLDLVKLGPEFANRYPRTLSGGQCQRVSIARSLVLNPDLMVLDESVSSLDVSVQAQVLNLLRELQIKLGLTYLFISHDLAVVRYMADNIAVMRQGKIVENSSREELYSNPKHHYTKSLMAAIPIADPLVERERRQAAVQEKMVFDNEQAV